MSATPTTTERQNVRLEPEAHARLKVFSATIKGGAKKVASDLIYKHLPPIKGQRKHKLR